MTLLPLSLPLRDRIAALVIAVIPLEESFGLVGDNEILRHFWKLYLRDPGWIFEPLSVTEYDFIDEQLDLLDHQ